MGVLIGKIWKIKSKSRLRYGRDSLGNYCGTAVGRDSQLDLKETRFLSYFYNASNPDLSSYYKKCVQRCPESAVTICKYGIDPKSQTDPGYVRLLDD